VSVSASVKERIRKKGEGNISTYQDFADLGNLQAVALTLSRLAKLGKIQRLSRGQYYVPKKTKFGNLAPSEDQILATIIQKNSGYIAGFSVLNRLGLTTQVPNEIEIRGTRSNRKRTIGNLRFKFNRGPSLEVSEKDALWVDVLEVLRLIKQIQGTDSGRVLKKVKALIGSNPSQIKRLIQLSQVYRPGVRALLGAILQDLKLPYWEELKRGLNPLTSYEFNISETQLQNKAFWKII